MKQLDFLGFEPSVRLRCFAGLGLAQISELLPTNSRSDAYLIQTAEGDFEAALKVETPQALLRASGRGTNAAELLREIFQSILDQWATQKQQPLSAPDKPAQRA